MNGGGMSVVVRSPVHLFNNNKKDRRIFKKWSLSLYNKSTFATHTQKETFSLLFSSFPLQTAKCKKPWQDCPLCPARSTHSIMDGPTSSSSTQMGKHTHHFRVSEQKRRATQWIKRFYSSTSTCVDVHKLCHPRTCNNNNNKTECCFWNGANEKWT